MLVRATFKYYDVSMLKRLDYVFATYLVKVETPRNAHEHKFSF